MATKKAYLHFPADQTSNPFVCELVRDFHLVVNIFRAVVTPGKDGYLSLELKGAQDDIDRGFAYLREQGVEIHSGDTGLMWRKDECTHCTNCTVHCPTGALHITDRATREVAFDESLCIECLACIANCPFGVCRQMF